MCSPFWGCGLPVLGGGFIWGRGLPILGLAYVPCTFACGQVVISRGMALRGFPPSEKAPVPTSQGSAKLLQHEVSPEFPGNFHLSTPGTSFPRCGGQSACGHRLACRTWCPHPMHSTPQMGTLGKSHGRCVTHSSGARSQDPTVWSSAPLGASFRPGSLPVCAACSSRK